MTSSTTLDRIRRRVEAGESPGIAAFLSVAPESVIAAAYSLSIALTIPSSDLSRVITAVAPGIRDAQGAVAELAGWPFVQRDVGGLRMTTSAAIELADKFRRALPEDFKRAHQILADYEAAREELDPEPWYTRGRIAFYLAGVDSQASMDEFVSAFESPPTLERGFARMWLTSLALRQSKLLGDHARELRFFEGFRSYVAGKPNDAKEILKEVLASGGADRIAAISGHLVGVLTRSEDIHKAVDLMAKSVRLSERLGLKQNEIMARNSLAWGLVDRARQEPERAPYDLRAAERYAAENADVARGIEDRTLIPWTEYAAANIGWIALTEHGRSLDASAEGRAEGFEIKLSQASATALAAGDDETSTLAANARAQVLRDVGRRHDAVTVLEGAFQNARFSTVDVGTLRHLAQTTGSVISGSSDQDLRTRARSLLGDLDDEIERRSPFARRGAGTERV